jgi:hypothetical protein
MSVGAVGWIADVRAEPPAWLLAEVSATVEDRLHTQWRASVFGVVATRAEAARREWRCAGSCSGGRVEVVAFDDLDE